MSGNLEITRPLFVVVISNLCDVDSGLLFLLISLLVKVSLESLLTLLTMTGASDRLVCQLTG